jgi:hypothetical protein
MIGAVGYKVITLNRNQKELYPTMNTFSKKSLHVALAGLSTLGLAGAAEAVMVNPNGLGQVLIYPYYTVRNGFNVGGVSAAPFNTLLSIVNTTASTKAIKVRFREGKASKEVLDFNVFLSPHDMWTAAVEPTDSIPGGPVGAQIETQDHTCTVPTFPNGPVPFRVTDFAGDVIGGGFDRLTEGYFEVFEMATYDPADPLAIGAKHNALGFPKDCSAVNDTSAAVAPLQPNGGLSGTATLINVLTGDAFSMDATALTQFNVAAGGAYFNTGSSLPDFTQATPTTGAGVSSSGMIVAGNFVVGELASTAALQHPNVINEFILDKATLSGTDWVLTFPTKHNLVTETTVTLPFQNVLGKNGSCDDIGIALYNREEGPPASNPGTDFSPLPPGQAGPALCWESNILTFNNSNVLGSANKYNISTGETNGWMNVSFRAGAVNVAAVTAGFDPSSGLATVPSTTFSGLPTIGFAVQTYVNGTLTDTTGKLIQSSYGVGNGHRYFGPQP